MATTFVKTANIPRDFDLFDSTMECYMEQSKFEECEYCAGTGKVPEARTTQPMKPKLPAMIECGKCKGSGQISRSAAPN